MRRQQPLQAFHPRSRPQIPGASPSYQSIYTKLIFLQLLSLFLPLPCLKIHLPLRDTHLPPTFLLRSPGFNRKKRTTWKKVDELLLKIGKEFDSLGHFLEVLFYNRISGVPDPRTPRHVRAVTAFLGGETNVTMSTIINLIYNHRQSRPSRDSPDFSLDFAPPDVSSPRDINFARPALSTWALQTVVLELRRQAWVLTQNDPDDPTDTTQLRAATNGRAKNVRLATWDAFNRVSIPVIASTYKRRARALWYATEGIAAPTINGVTVLRKRRPHIVVQVGAISSLVLSRNRYANGYLALPIAVWLFACKTHVDEKRIFSRFGFTVHDTTARACLDSLTDSSLAKLRESVAEGIANGTMRWQIVLDNVQQYCRQRDHRLGRQDVLKVGTAATAILLEDCAPGAFDLQDHLDRVMKQERRQLTIDSLWEDIDWAYIHELTALLWVRVLVHFIPQLAHLRKEVAANFSSDAMTKHRLPTGRITVMQPFGTNTEHSTETQGMFRALLDFMGQMGLDEKSLKNLIFMPRGDGASVAAIWRIKKYLCTHPEHYKAFRNVVPPGPEIFHTRWTELNAISANSYGPASSADPSVLSKSATAAGAKRPSNLKKVDFFPTSRSMKLFFEARVLDCWRIWFGAEDIIEYFAEPMHDSDLPDLLSLLVAARKLVKRYASQQAYTQALNKDFADTAHADMKVPLGTPWVAPAETSRAKPDDAGGEPEEEMDPKRPTVHVEADDFMGDRVMANEILFLQDMGWWIIASDAIPDGEIGRYWEIMKIWILCFAGSGNHNYTNYLLETYCLHRYEASKDFSNAMLNNSLINLRGHKYIECDWVQEDYNKWLEEMVEHKGGDFDDHFYRHTLAPNVMHFLRMKEKMETAFELKPRGKTHGAPHLRNEFQQLLRMHKEDQLHLFRPGRSMGHATVNFFEHGYQKLEDTHIAKFIRESTAYSDITKDVLDGQEYDDWDEEMQKKFDQWQAEQAAVGEDSDSEAESETESVTGDDSGDVGIGGMDYSDTESESDEEGQRSLRFEEPEDDLEGAQENEDLSEMEEEGMDNYVPLVDDLDPED
ncbi:hypothetical protein DFH07DRAFT_726168 [Mycena maculata]|uniref:DUF6589 domain-containing protein n=1 Tax=Mycena maculata TaxID=230809 RepID=A0AAD7P2H3_9AGAR|nr:hypothetical protein DFH07DRAFT_726168 [Mycena maculata]